MRLNRSENSHQWFDRTAHIFNDSDCTSRSFGPASNPKRTPTHFPSKYTRLGNYCLRPYQMSIVPLVVHLLDHIFAFAETPRLEWTNVLCLSMQSCWVGLDRDITSMRSHIAMKSVSPATINFFLSAVIRMHRMNAFCEFQYKTSTICQAWSNLGRTDSNTTDINGPASPLLPFAESYTVTTPFFKRSKTVQVRLWQLNA